MSDTNGALDSEYYWQWIFLETKPEIIYFK